MKFCSHFSYFVEKFWLRYLLSACATAPQIDSKNVLFVTEICMFSTSNNTSTYN